VSNTGGALKPGMFANLSIASGRGAERVLVASEAVIRTGERSVVIVAEEGRYRAVEVEVGQELGGRSEILRGLDAGQRVVASGQFLIDSEASLKGTLARLQPAGAAKHAGSGKVIAIDAAKRRLELEHGPIPALKWPAMQMEFAVSDPAILQGVKPGDEVSFEMRAEQSREGDWVIEALRPRVGK
jgi:Cu(I)/Ag(I) efflux system membrane fusion protein